MCARMRLHGRRRGHKLQHRRVQSHFSVSPPPPADGQLQCALATNNMIPQLALPVLLLALVLLLLRVLLLRVVVVLCCRSRCSEEVITAASRS